MILITGANGQLGSDLVRLLDEKGAEYKAVTIDDMDITKVADVEKVFEQIQPDVVYHCLAYTAVDMAEDEGHDLNYLVNVLGTVNIAKATEKYGAKLVYISTDYVFSGKKPKGEKWHVNDSQDPQNEYGRAKLLGEEAVKRICSKFYIVRTSWVFGKYGKNFVFTMQDLAKTHKTISVVNDQFGRPTWARTLAEFMVFLIENSSAYGIYHLSNDSEDGISWYEFAKEILKNTDIEVLPVNSDEFLTKAKRPENSTMDLEKTKATGFTIPTWKEALEAFGAQ